MEDYMETLKEKPIIFFIDSAKDYLLYCRTFDKNLFTEFKNFLEEHHWVNYFDIDEEKQLYMSKENVFKVEDEEFQSKFVEVIVKGGCDINSNGTLARRSLASMWIPLLVVIPTTIASYFFRDEIRLFFMQFFSHFK